jgi:hypothetical protein
MELSVPEDSHLGASSSKLSGVASAGLLLKSSSLDLNEEEDKVKSARNDEVEKVSFDAPQSYDVEKDTCILPFATLPQLAILHPV